MKNKLWIALLGTVALLIDGTMFAQQLLKQSTATTVNIEAIDSATFLGKTGIAVTGITCDLVKQSDTLASTKTTFTCAASGSSNDCVEIAHGAYNLELSTGNTDTLGRLSLYCQASGALFKTRQLLVVADATYQVNVTGNISDNTTMAAAVWDRQTTALTTSGSAGERLVTDLDATVSSRLAPTVAGNTLDVTSTGAAGIDWANVENPTTTLGLTGTTISTGQTITSVSGAVGSVTGNVGGSVGSVTGAVGSVTGAVGSVTGAVGSVTGNVGGNVTGSVGSVASGGITTGSFAAGAINAAAIGTDAITATKIAADAIGASELAFSAMQELGVDTGTAASGSANTITLDANASAIDGAYLYSIIVLTTGPGAGQRAVCSGYNGTTKVATIFNQAVSTGNWATNPTGATTYAITSAVRR